VHDLERISLSAYLPAYGAHALEVGGATCLRFPPAPHSPMLNRVVGLGLDRPLDETVLDEALAAMGDATFYVAVAPDADPALDRLLEERGLERGWGWMLFERGPSAAAGVDTSLSIVEVGDSEAGAWAYVVASAYGLPAATLPWFGAIPALAGWHAFLALDGDEPAAAAAVWIDPPAAYFGMAGTLPGHRGKGGQGALLAVRIERAREAGCTKLVSETGERHDDLPSNSYRNILRHGFEERYVVAHRLRRPEAS